MDTSKKPGATYLWFLSFRRMVFDRDVKLEGTVAGLLKKCRRQVSCRGANDSTVKAFPSIVGYLRVFRCASRLEFVSVHSTTRQTWLAQHRPQLIALTPCDDVDNSVTTYSTLYCRISSMAPLLCYYYKEATCSLGP